MTRSSATVMGQNGTEWQVTATTVRCECVADFATIMVQPDGTAKCSYVNRLGKARDSMRNLQLCKWPECPLVAEFRRKALTM
jgi:hypothetical protein